MIKTGVSRHEYNLEQAFQMLRKNLNDYNINYDIIKNVNEGKKSKDSRVTIQFKVKNRTKITIIYYKELRNIKTIYNIIASLVD